MWIHSGRILKSNISVLWDKGIGRFRWTHKHEGTKLPDALGELQVVWSFSCEKEWQGTRLEE